MLAPLMILQKYALLHVLDVKFIDKLALATGKAGGDLTNAFIKLSQATGDATTSQKLLQTALDISGATGKDLQSVSVALGKAFQGETTALAKLGIGYTTAELQGVKFDELLKLLNSRFGGAAAKAADTYAGKLARIGQAADLAKEKIGEGFVDGLEESGVSVEEFQEAIINLGTNIGRALGKITAFAGKIGEEFDKLKDNPVINLLLKISETVGALKGLKALGGLFNSGPADDPAKIRSAARLRREIYRQEQENLKKNLTLTKALTKEKKDQLALDKAALALGKGEDIFDLDKIQVQAALLAKQDEINKLGVNATDQQKLQLANDITRLSIKKTMAELEDAIAAKDVEAATRLAKKLNLDLAILGALQNQEFKLADINKILETFKPKKLIDIDNLDEALLLLAKMAGLKININPNLALNPNVPITPITPITPKIPATNVAGQVATLTSLRATTSTGTGINFLLKEHIDTLTDAISNNALNALGDEQARLRAMGIFDTAGIGAGFDVAGFRRGEERGNTYNVNINAGVIGNEDGVALVVQRAILDLERKGDPLRYTGGL